ncbi:MULTISPECIES: TonB-dependent receptor [Sphingomonas]|uniref:TonB-dependent receptor n=1 Tax=Sphingomonas molluscorum TaxID=418184 RepID=A0ABU8Q8N2_9SPHN|nr:TonB-dependent receptor [Sphingomonas sp. JUb134]MBM7407415.1 catecholate siderophore receptor [Sphingomonas sp. JUb134]
MKQHIAARTPGATFLALSCVGFIASSPAAAAPADPVVKHGTTEPDDQILRTDEVVVTGEVYSPRQESPKNTRKVRDMPQTVTVITNETIEQQNLLTLRDVLTTVPGITFGAGEGGAGFGDAINLRGYSANSDITQDGVRDSAQYTRTDSFNLEQLEVVNGANSVYAGSGSVGGSINLVTKRPLAIDRTVVTGGIGTDDYYRGTVDTNVRVSDLVAVRLNAMAHKNDVPGRDVENYRRWGLAPSVTIGIEGPTRLTFQYLHQEDENIPQYGVPYYINATNDGPLPGVDRSSYYGFRNIDTQESNVDQFTATFEHEFSDRVSIRNLTRWQDVRQLTLVDPPQGTFCLADNLTAVGAPCTNTQGQVVAPAGFYLPSGPRGNTRDTRNQLGFNQIDLRAVVDTGGIEHTITLGAAVSWEKFFLSSGNSLRNSDGSTPFTSLPLMSIGNPNDVVTGPAGFTYGNNVYDGPVNFIPSARQTGVLENYAAYFFDAIKFSDHFEINGGVRYEHNKGWNRSDVVQATSTGALPLGTVTPGERLDNKDNLFSYRIGAVYKPVEAVSLYAAYGNSETPSKTSVNGSCTEATCNVKPESAKNYEIGAKAELSDGRLLLTAALFRNERDQYKVATGDPTIPEQQLDGKSRVDGIALGAVGRITPAWTITANYTYLDSEVLRSIARNSPPGTIDPQRGNPLTNTPEHSGSLFTTYRLPFGLQLGYGLTYQGSFYLSNSTPDAATVLYKVDDYLVHNAYLAYDFTPNFSAQLNVKNVGDTEYYTRVRNNASTGVGWATPGEARSAVLTLSYRM